MKSFLLATRPKTLLATLGPVILGLALAKAPLQWPVAILTIACALLLQVGTNLVNDYYDGKNGLDDNRLGPERAYASGKLSPQFIRNSIWVTFILATALGIFLMVRGGWPIIIIGLSSLLFAYAYTGGPFPLSYFGLGEVAAFIFFGPIAVAGTTYLQDLTYSPLPILAGCGLGFLAATLMSVNNLRDNKNDSKNGKTTIAVWLGENRARFFTLSLVTAASLLSIVLYIQFSRWPLLLGAFLPLLFLKEWRSVYRDPIDTRLNKVLGKTGLCLFLYSIALSFGLYQ